MFIYAFECLTCLIEDLKNIKDDLKMQKLRLNLALTYQNHLMSNHSELANILRRNTGPDFPLSFFRQPCRSIVVWYLPVRMDYWHLLEKKRSHWKVVLLGHLWQLLGLKLLPPGALYWSSVFSSIVGFAPPGTPCGAKGALSCAI